MRTSSRVPRRDAERSKLLPRWIRAFSWIFLLFLVAVPALHILGVFYDGPMQFAIFGFEHRGRPGDPPALAIQAVLIALGVAAFGLLWGKPWGLNAGLATGGVGLAAVAVSSALAWSSGELEIRLEPFLQIPFLVALVRLRPAWSRSLAQGPAQSAKAAAG